MGGRTLHRVLVFPAELAGPVLGAPVGVGDFGARSHPAVALGFGFRVREVGLSLICFGLIPGGEAQVIGCRTRLGFGSFDFFGGERLARVRLGIQRKADPEYKSQRNPAMQR